jgi:hypothetical protein
MITNTATAEPRALLPTLAACSAALQRIGESSMTPREGRRRWRQASLLALLSAFVLGAGTPAVASGGSERECRDVRVPVALTEGAPVTDSIYGQLCAPAGQSPAGDRGSGARDRLHP